MDDLREIANLPKCLTIAMAAGVTDRLWDIEGHVAIADAAEFAPKQRGPYEKKVLHAD